MFKIDVMKKSDEKTFWRVLIVSRGSQACQKKESNRLWRHVWIKMKGFLKSSEKHRFDDQKAVEA